MARYKGVGAVPSSVPAAVKPHLSKVTEAVQVLLGESGDPDGLDRAIRFRDLGGDGLSAAQIALIGGIGGGTGTGGGTTVIIGGPGGGGADDPPDLTPPPVPTGLTVGGGFAYVYVNWDVASYSVGHGPASTQIYAVQKETNDPTLPTFSQAVLVASAPHALTLIAIPSEPARRWHVWIKFKSKDGVESVSPAGGTNGVQATTAIDVAHVLKALTNQITTSQLFSDLGTQIGLISADQNTPGSVAWRVQQEAIARGTAISTETNTRTAADLQLAQQISTVAAVSSSNSAAITQLQQVSVGDGAVTATQLALVAAQMSGSEYVPNAQFVENGGFWDPALLFDRTAAGVPTGAPSDRVMGHASRDTTPTSFTGQFAARAVTPQQVFDLQVWCNSPAGAVTAGILLLLMDAGGNIVSNDTSCTFVASAAWRQVKSSFVVPAGVYSIIPVMWVNQAFAPAAGNKTVWFSAPSVVRQNSAQSAAIQQEATARVNADGVLFAQYSVKIDVNGYVSGYGLSSTAAGATPFSSFIIRADSFAIAAPSGPGIAPITPFIVRTTPGSVNGVSYPAGVYIDSAYILDLTAAIARMGTAWIDNADIANLSAAKLTVGDGTIGGNLKSANFVSGTAGWIMRPDGFFESTNGIFRGGVYASYGTIGGIVMTGNSGLQSSNWASGSAGFRFDYLGNAQLNSVSIRGNIAGGSYVGYAWPASGLRGFYLGPEGLLLGNANDGQFFQVTATGDIYSGSFTIINGVASFNSRAVNAVDTPNLRPGAATTVIPAFTPAATAAGYSQSAGLPSAKGGLIKIDFSALLNAYPAGGGTNTSPAINAIVQLFRNGALIYQGAYQLSPTTVLYGETNNTSTTSYKDYYGNCAFTIVDNPGAGAWTYQVNATVITSQRALVVTEYSR